MKGITATMMLGLLCLVSVVNVRAAATLNNAVQTNGSLVISWDSRGTLENANQLSGPWTTITNAQNPYTNTSTSGTKFFRLNQTVDASSLHKKVLCGYQGWFRCPGDGGNQWIHWSRSSSTIASNTLSFEMWPEVSEYTNKYPAPGFTYPDGSQAYLFSSQDQQTVDRHFDWMLEYGIDGVFVQRFVVGVATHPTNVLNNARSAANRTGRIFSITYDMSGQSTNNLFNRLTNDWVWLVDNLHITQDPRYLHHNGKPVLMIWGFFTDRMSTNLAHQIIDFFKTDPTYGVTLVGGGAWWWQSETAPGWSNVFRRFDVYSPWNVGNVSIDGTNKYASTAYWSQDLPAATSAGMLYLPVIYPGFSWDNLQQQPPGTSLIPRLAGEFLWRQFHAAANLGLDMAYVAMFDEVDEGTAIFKVSNTPPTQGHFVSYDGLPSDWYLRLTAEGSKILSGERPNTAILPISPWPPLSVSLSATPTNSSGPPLTVQFTAQASGGKGAPVPYDTTDDQLGTVTAAGENNGLNGNFELATYAFDNTLAKWLDFANGDPATRSSWLQYQYPGSLQRVVTNYTLTTANDAPERDPADWALLGSNNGGATWVTLDTQAGQFFDQRYETRAFPIASPGPFNIYRLRIDSVADPASAIAVQLAEIQLLGTQKYTYWWSFGDGTTGVSEQIGVPVQLQHTYNNSGTYTVVLGVTYGDFRGTNTITIKVGP
jgi:hypothetical protein